MLIIDYVLAKMGYTRVTPRVVRLSMYQEAFFTNLAKDVARLPDSVQAMVQLEPYFLNQKAITKFLREGQMTVNLVQE